VGLFPLARRLARGLHSPAELVIGADGITVKQGFARQFIPFAAIARIDTGRGRRNIYGAVLPPIDPVTIDLKDGSQVVPRTVCFTADQQAELAARLADAQEAFAAGACDSDATARLDRNGRSARAWRDALRDALATAGGYRAEALDPNGVVRVLESPAAPVERRIGAALALAASMGDEGRTRICVAAAACANPRVRIALEKAARGALADADLDAALAADAEVVQGREARRLSR
jgi:hypothetical protein